MNTHNTQSITQLPDMDVTGEHFSIRVKDGSLDIFDMKTAYGYHFFSEFIMHIYMDTDEFDGLCRNLQLHTSYDVVAEYCATEIERGDARTGNINRGFEMCVEGQVHNPTYLAATVFAPKGLGFTTSNLMNMAPGDPILQKHRNLILEMQSSTRKKFNLSVRKSFEEILQRENADEMFIDAYRKSISFEDLVEKITSSGGIIQRMARINLEHKKTSRKLLQKFLMDLERKNNAKKTAASGD